MSLSILKAKTTELVSELDHARKRLREEREAYRDAENHLAVAEEAQKALQEIAQRIQQQVHDHLAGIVTHCIQAVFFEHDWQFKLKFHKRRCKTEADIVFVKDEHELDPTTAAGLGVVDVAAFAARLACLKMSKPRVRQLLVLDEPFRFVNGEKYQDRMIGMIEELAEKLEVQFIIISDDPWVEAGKVYSLGRNDA